MAINVKINGIPVQLERPMNVIEAAKKVGIHVPHFCYHKELTLYAGCRICMVEVKGRPKLMPGCTTVMTDGMEVVTESEKLTASRRGILELQLAHHPLDCPVCDKGGECLLQDYAYKYGAGRGRFQFPKREIPVNYENPLIERNMERCVSCKRCARICTEIQGDNVLWDMERGSRTVFGSFMGKEDECVHCGHCLSVCPVGAVQSRLYKHISRPWYIERQAETICPYCGDGCTLTLQTREDKIQRVVSDETYSKGANRGSLCVRGRFGLDFPNSPERISKPLIKKDGYFVEASWDEAAGFVADKLHAIKSSAGPDAIGAVIGGRNTNEEAYLLQKFMRATVGTNNVDNMARLGHINALTALEEAFGLGGMTNQIKDIASAKAVLLIGNDAAAENPITALAIKKAVIKGGATLILADSFKNTMAKHARQRLSYRPGTALELVKGLINFVFASDLQDKALEEKDKAAFDRVRAYASESTPDKASVKTGVPADDIKNAAEAFAKAEAAAIVLGRGVTADTDGYECCLALADLSYITGNVGKAGGGVNPMASKAGEQGACDVGALPDRLPGYRKVSHEDDRKRLGLIWNTALPEKPGLTAGEMLQAASEGKLSAMYLVGTNMAYEMPDSKKACEALNKLKLLVVQDIFMSETAKLAHVVLPAATFAEKEGTFTNSERRVQLITPAINVQDGCKPDGEIMSMVSGKMGHPMEWSPSLVMDEISKASPIHAGISYAVLQDGGVQWPYFEEMKSGTPILHVEGIEPKTENRESLSPESKSVQKPEGFPFTLDAAVSLYHSGTTSRKTKGPNLVVGRPVAGLNPEDASALGVGDGAIVKISSGIGEIELPVKVDREVPKGTVHVPSHFEGAGCGVLAGMSLQNVNKVPAARYWPVALEIKK